MLSRRSGELAPNATMTAAKRLARLGTGVLAALLFFGAVLPAHGAVPVAQADAGLKVQDRSHDNEERDLTLYALYQVINTGTASVPLSSLTMRYWFTNQTPADPLVFECDWAQVNCSNITAKFVVLPSPVNKANTYLEISFKAGAGSLAPGRGTGEIQTRIHHANWSEFLATESYSFISDPSFVYKDTQTVTLYQGGTLIWGVEPTR
ncbi:MAG: cellulose binding domain-containing protein [Labedaea sp.]